jgi:hypothetical protein
LPISMVCMMGQGLEEIMADKIKFKKIYRSKNHKVERRKQARQKQMLVWKTLTAKS